METSTTKIDNIIDQLVNHNYTSILKNLKKLLSKDPNQPPLNMLLIQMLRGYSFFNLKKFKKAEESIFQSFKYADHVTLEFFSNYHFLFTIILTITQNDSFLDQFLDQVHELPNKVFYKKILLYTKTYC